MKAIADSVIPKAVREKLTLPQWCLLCEAEQNGRTLLLSEQHVTAHKLQEKRFGTVTTEGRHTFFNLNEEGRALLK